MKCLMFTKKSQQEGVQSTELPCAIASLDSLGIKFERATIENPPSNAKINTYDFILFPSMASGMSSITRNADITIPMFMLSSSAFNDEYPTAPGVSGGRASLADRWLDVPWTNEPWVAAFGGSYTLTTGTALATVSAIDTISGSAQTNAGQVFAWSGDTDGESKFYASGFYATNHAVLPFLIQTAINDGILTSPPRKAPIVVDYDHVNGPSTNVDPTILDKVASYVPKGGIIWAGIWNANASEFGDMSDELKNKLKKYQGAPFKYCWHDHTFSPNIVTGALDAGTLDTAEDGTSTNVTKAQIAARYDADEGIWNGLDLVFHQPGYYNSGSNAWENFTLQLFGRDVAKESSPLNDTEQAGYGFKVFRGIQATPRASNTHFNIYENPYKNKRRVSGVLLITTMDVGSDLLGVANSIADWRNQFRFLCNSISMGMSMYVHDSDFVAADQDPGVNRHGYVQMQMIADVGVYLKDVTKVFADPTDYVH